MEKKRSLHLGNIFPFVSLRHPAFLGFNIMWQNAWATLEGQSSSLDQVQQTSVVCWQLRRARSLADASWNGYSLKIELTVLGNWWRLKWALGLFLTYISFRVIHPFYFSPFGGKKKSQSLHDRCLKDMVAFMRSPRFLHQSLICVSGQHNEVTRYFAAFHLGLFDLNQTPI